MKNRRVFLTAVASGGVGLSLAALEAAAKSSPSPAPAASATASSAKAASAAAVATAAAMRAFDPALSAGELQTIAKAIDTNTAAAKALNPKKKRLANGEGPAVRFVVVDGPA